jgi:hypothetical protein
MVLSHEEMFTTLKSNFFSDSTTTIKASFARVSQNNRKTDLADFARLGPNWLSTHASCF